MSLFYCGTSPDEFRIFEKKERYLNDCMNDNDEDYEEYDDDEGTIHPISSDTDPNVLLHTLTHSKHHQSFSDDISHFSNSRIIPVTRKISHLEDSSHLSVPLPGPPRVVQAAIIKPRFVTLTWQEPFENPDEVISYTVYYKMNNNDARERKINILSRDEQEVNLHFKAENDVY